MKTFKQTVELLSLDLKRLAGKDSKLKGVRYLLTNHSFQVCFFFRWIQYLQQTSIKPFKLALIFCLPVYKVVQHWAGIQMPTSTKVGGGLLFAFAGS